MISGYVMLKLMFQTTWMQYLSKSLFIVVLRSSQHYTDSDKSIQMAGHHNMTAAHATLAVDVSYFSIQWSSERSGSALYGRFYLQTGCAYGECNEEHAQMNFLLISSTHHISETKASIFVAFALKSSATYLFYDDCV